MIIDFNSPDSIDKKDKRAVAAIIQEAFWSKYKWFFRKFNKEKALPIFEKIITYDLGYFVKEDDQVLGACLLSLEGRPHIRVTPEVRRHIGFWRSLLLSKALVSSPDNREALYLQMIAVGAKARGKGIGGKMLDHLDKIAGDLGVPEIQLDVINSNAGAIALYTRKGYLKTRQYSTRFITKDFGFDGVHIMIKKSKSN